jgi:hypothetical protein
MTWFITLKGVGVLSPGQRPGQTGATGNASGDLGSDSVPVTDNPSLRPLPTKNLGCGAGHVHVVVGFRPLQFEVSAGEVGEEFSPGPTGENACDAHRTGAGSTREGDPAAPFPGSHRDFARANAPSQNARSRGEGSAHRARSSAPAGPPDRSRVGLKVLVRRERTSRQCGFPIDTQVTSKVHRATIQRHIHRRVARAEW